MSNQVMKSALLASCVVLLTITPVLAAISFNLQTRTAPFGAKVQGNLEVMPKALSYLRNQTNGPPVQRNAAPGSLILFGGSRVGWFENDVWISEDNGVSWSLISGHSTRGATGYAEAPNHAATSFVYLNSAPGAVDSKGNLYRIGGELGTAAYSNDVWWSPDAQVWQKVSPPPAQGFAARRFSGACVDKNDRIYISGGYGCVTVTGPCSETTFGDIWYTDNQGATWTQTSVGSQYRFSGLQPWAGIRSATDNSGGRGVAVHVAYYDQDTSTNIQLITTGSSQPAIVFNDVWASADGGQQWTRICANAPWRKRNDANGEISSAGVFVITSGQTEAGANQEVLNDVWASLDGGWTWGLCVLDAIFEDRRYLLTALDKDGHLIVLGGVATGDVFFNDVWRSDISFNNPSAVASACGLKVPACGTGLKCWPGPGTYLDANNMIQCATCQQISGSSDQSGSVAALAVFMVLFLLIAIGASYYAYTLRKANNNGGGGGGVRTNNILGIGSEDSSSLYKPLSFREGPSQ